MKKLILISLPIYFLGLLYLTIPTPTLPDLSDSFRSQESGDTWQHPDQKAFYTQKNRSTVLREIQTPFSLSLLGFTLPSFRLNYPPEEAQTLVRDQTVSTYLEEIVHPLRESLFVNGNEPENAPKNASIDPEFRPTHEVEGRYYFSKITLRPVYSAPPSRYLIWSLILPASYFVFLSLKKSIYA